MNEAPSLGRFLAKVVQVSAKEPFTLTSGHKSPVYVDCRRVLGDVAARRWVVRRFAERAKKYEPQVIAGGETAGIPLAAMLAEKMGLPMAYIRKKPKGFGQNALVEGMADFKGMRVVLVEDLSTDGGSKRHFLDVIRKFGGRPVAVLVIFSYGLERGLGIPLEALADWDNFLLSAERSGHLGPEQVKTVRDYLSARKKART